MNLKESYRYANYLYRLLNTAYMYLNNKGFVTSTKETHLRSKANSEANDEVIEVPKSYDVDFTPNQVIDFVVKVIDEKENLANAITMAKMNPDINIDNAVSLNKKKQEFVRVLNNLANIKASESISTGRAYKFDANGEQKPYVYDVVSTKSIDFNRNDVRNLAKKYLKETDDISSKLDSIEINTEVLFECSFDINDSFEDLVLA